MYRQFLAKFRKFEASHKHCGMVFCTTCRGLAHAIKSSMTNELDNEIRLTLSTISLESFALNDVNSRLFNLAMRKFETNRNIHWVLYNNLRVEIPELRGFVGDATSVRYFKKI